MKVAAVSWNEYIQSETTAVSYMSKQMKALAKDGVGIVVFPAFTSTLFHQTEHFLTEMAKLSTLYPDILVCPGSYWEKEAKLTFHTAICLLNGQIIHRQRQLYLSRWERQTGLSRGSELTIFSYRQMKLAIILNTDVFYPQVSRHAAMPGVQLVLSPVAILSTSSFSQQISGLWQNVQQNLFYAIESSFSGTYGGQTFHAESIIHGPLEITE